MTMTVRKGRKTFTKPARVSRRKAPVRMVDEAGRAQPYRRLFSARQSQAGAASRAGDLRSEVFPGIHLLLV
jgi:hypothetical protein